jgi:starch synthase
MPLSVLSVASEAYPLVKTGGLADVVGALPAALAPHGVDLTTLLPAYPEVKAKAGRTRRLHDYDDLLGTKAKLLSAKVDGHPFILLDAPALFERPGGPYAAPTGKDWDDNWLRFAALSRAAADLASGTVGSGYDLLHAHDWQAGLAPAYLQFASRRVVPSVMTIHNMAFQGQCSARLYPRLCLPDSAWSVDGVEYYGDVGFLKAGMACATAITTVSPTYAREIRQNAFGMGLEGLVRARESDMHGILNGIDPAIWNPANDPLIPARYTARTLPKRSANRRAIESAFALDHDDHPLFTVISRLTWQKGMDVLADCLDALVTKGGKLALLGSGDPALEESFTAAALRHPGRIGVRIGYDEPLSHLLQAGADAILIPSRFEPCGLTQLYGLAYGCVPVVARTGGLADSVIDANDAALANGVATGLVFDGLSQDSLISAIGRAIKLHAEQPLWSALQRQGMRSDFSWTASGARYAAVYRSLAKG